MLTIKDLKSEYTETPLGIDCKKPRFSWRLESVERDQKQSAYRIIVTDGKNELWDSKKVRENSTNNIVYEGEPLASFTRYYWYVRIWDDDGEEFTSETTWFETAALGVEFIAPWIGLNKEFT
ncbi:MAG: alfa-L-rhamnosidase, partial [Clostridiales bacterium]|nr:alfa-L-rhamnosidase [Clostridiales bacterium]